MEFLFADYTQKTEALVTGVRLQNEAFDIYELQLLGLDKNDSCSYTNSGNSDNIGYRIARTVAYKRTAVSNAMFYLTYNYTNARRSRMAIACVIRCKNTYGKQLRVRDIIEMHRPGLHQLLSRGDQCRVGRAISRLYNQGMLPHLNRGKKKGSTNTYYC